MERRRGGLGRKRFSSPPFHRQSRRLRTGVREQKVAALGAMSPREQANLYPPLSEGVPTLLSPPPHTPTTLPTHPLPSPTYNREPKSPEEKGERSGQFRTQNSPPPSAGMGLQKSEIVHGLGGEVERAGGSLTAVRPRAAAPSLAPWAGGERGSKGRGPPE